MSSANVIVERNGDTTGTVRVPSGAAGGGGISLSPRPTPAPRQAPPPRRVPASAPPRVSARDMRDTFGGLANTSKLLPPEEDASDEEDEEEEEEDAGGSGGGSDVSGEDDEEDAGELPDDENEPFEDELTPSDGFRTLEEEKSDIIFKLNRLKKQGMPGLRQFTVHSDIRDMRTELKRIRTEMELDSSLKFQRKMLMAVVGGLEYMNRKYSPLELQLDGWSETVHENIGEYDSVFEQLYFKYRNKVSMPPEVSLILMVGGSAMMFHYTNAMMKSATSQMNPAALQAMFQNMQQPPQQPQPPQQQPPQQPPVGPQPPYQPQLPPYQPPADPQRGADQRRPMRGPGVDLGALLGGLPPTLPVMAFPQPSQPRQAPPPPVIQEVRPADAESDRLSDVVSEDLQSIPEDLQSVASELGGGRKKRGVKEITLDDPGRKKRGKGAKAVRNVVVI